METSPQDQAFSLVQDRYCSLPVKFISLCPMMDLTAIVHSDDGIAVRRTFTWEKILDLSSQDGYGSGSSMKENSISCICWSPNGEKLVFGFENGIFMILDIENMEIVQPVGTTAIQRAQIKILYYIYQDLKEDEKRLLSEGKDTAIDEMNSQGNAPLFFGNLAFQAPSGNNLETSHFTADKERPQSLEFLFSCDQNCNLSAFIHGELAIMDLNLSSALSKEANPIQLCAVHDMSFLVLCTSDTSGVLSATTLDTHVFSDCSQALRFLTSHHSALSALLPRLRAGVAEAGSKWRQALRVLNVKLGLLQGLLQDRYASPTTPRDEFFRMAAFGNPSPALEQFLSQNLTEQNLARLLKQVEAATNHVEALLRDHLLPIARVVLFRAGEIRGSALSGNQFSQAGLEDNHAQNFLMAARLLAHQVERVLCEVRTARGRLRDFLDWLLLLVIQTGSDEPLLQCRAPPDIALTRRILVFLKLHPENGTRDVTEQILGTSVAELLGQNSQRSEKAAADQMGMEASHQEGHQQLSILELVEKLTDRTLLEATLLDQVGKLNESFALIFQRSKAKINASINPLRTVILGSSATGDIGLHFRPCFEATGIPQNSKMHILQCFSITKGQNEQRLRLVCSPITERNDHRDYICEKDLQPGDEIVQILFYGNTSGIAFESVEQIGIVIRKKNSGQIQLVLVSYDDWHFECSGTDSQHFPDSHTFDTLSPPREQSLGILCYDKSYLMTLSNENIDSSISLALVVSKGKYGVASIIVGGSRVMMFDLEEAEDNDDDIEV